jgi:cell division protein FtsW (lipid II flippase)
VFAVLRVAVLLFAAALAVCVLSWLITRDPKWKRRAWLVFKYGVFGLTLLLVLFAGQALLQQGA